MRYLIIHSSLTQQGVDYSKESIAKIHEEDPDLKGCGFQDVIKIDGQVESMLEFNPKRRDNWIYKDVFEFIRGCGRHLAYTGGVSDGFITDTRTKEQRESIGTYFKYMNYRHPGLKIAGYSKVSGFDSEGFKVDAFLKDIGLKDCIL